MKNTFLIFSLLFIGCGKADPVADQDAVQKEIEQLNEHREREWNDSIEESQE